MIDVAGVIGAVVGAGRGAAGPVYECRRCGTTLTAGEERCPYCGPTDVVTFELTG
jgi:rubrerythrin